MARLVDAASLAAAKVVKGQAAFINDATRAACDSMTMNGAPVVMSNASTCAASQGASMTATVEFFDLPVNGGPAVKAVRVTANEPMPTTFMRFLGWMAPGDYSKIDVVARAEAGPERPVDLMLVLVVKRFQVRGVPIYSICTRCRRRGTLPGKRRARSKNEEEVARLFLLLRSDHQLTTMLPPDLTPTHAAFWLRLPTTKR